MCVSFTIKKFIPPLTLGKHAHKVKQYPQIANVLRMCSKNMHPLRLLKKEPVSCARVKRIFQPNLRTRATN